MSSNLTMNNKVELTEALLKSISQVVNNYNSRSTTVIEGIITKIIDVGNGIYEFEYSGNKRPAVASNKNYTYNVGDRVYILIPDGDMDKTKIIIGVVSSAGNRIEIQDQSNYYLPFGDNVLLVFNNTERTPFSLNTFHDQQIVFDDQHEPQKDTGVDFNLPNMGTIFQTFNSTLNYTRNFDFNFKVKTNIIDTYRRINGNYGLYLRIPILVNEVIEKNIEIVFDINEMLGNPYNFSEYVQQHFYFNIPDNAKINDKQIIILKGFVYGFPKDATEQEHPDDIFFSDIGITPVKVLSYAEKVGYNLKLVASPCSFFADNVQGSSSISELNNSQVITKDLIPNLYNDGKLVDLQSKNEKGENLYKCYWFVENNKINTYSFKYHSLGGTGWEILNDEKQQKDVPEEDPYDTSKYIYKVYKDRVRFELKYKCVIITSDNQVLADTILIKNLSSSISLDLFTDKNPPQYTEDIGTVKLTMKYSDNEIESLIANKYTWVFSWKRFNRLGAEADFDVSQSEIKTLNEEEKYIQDDVSYNVIGIDKANSFQCTVSMIRTYETEEVDPNTGEHILATEEYIIGSRSITVTTTQALNLNVQLENDIHYFKYDWSGNSPLLANYDGNAATKEKLIQPITISKISDETGREFTEDELKTFEVEWFVPTTTVDENGEEIVGTMLLLDFNYYNITDWKKVTLDNGKTYFSRRGNFEELKSLRYTIQNKYNQNYAKKGNNVIILKVYLASQGKEVIRYINNIIFEKDGKSGTNGTNYTAVITYGINKGDGVFYEYGELDPDSGFPHKCQLLYINDIEEWFIFNPGWISESNPLGLLWITDGTGNIDITYTDKGIEGQSTSVTSWKNKEESGSNRFEVEMYCQGDKIDFNTEVSLNNKWKIFDEEFRDNSNIICPITIDMGTGEFNIKDKPGVNDKSWSDFWKDITENQSPYTVMTIVQVSAKAQQPIGINKNAEYDPTNSDFLVYAYYPIEVTYLSYQSLIHDYIPTMQGGFDNVLYGSGGLQPEFDNAYPFKIYGVEGIEKIEEDILAGEQLEGSVCEYHWSISDNLFTPENETEETLLHSTQISVQPKGKYDNGKNKNYIKVEVDFNDSLKTEIAAKRNAAETQDDDISNYLYSYEIIQNNCDIFNNFHNDKLTCPYNQIKIMVSDSAQILALAKNYLNILNDIYVQLMNLNVLIQTDDGRVQNIFPLDFYNEYYVAFQNILRNKYIESIKAEINYVNQLTQETDIDHITNILGNIANLFILSPGEKRYVFNDDEMHIIEVFTENWVSIHPADWFLNDIYDKVQSYQVFITGSNYFNYYDQMQNSSIAFEDRNTKIEAIKNQLLSFLSEGPNPANYSQSYPEDKQQQEKWSILLTFDTYGSEDLLARKDSFIKLNEILWSYYYSISFGEDINLNPFGTIINAIERMDEILNAYKNYSVDKQINALRQQKNEYNNEFERLDKLYNLVSEADKKYKIIHTKPILMLMNRYELGYLGGWDGNKLKIDEDGGYILSPIMGAGRKEADNSYTGMIMGIYQNPNDVESRVGLFGKSQGKETLFLDSQTGAASFGVSGEGQIYIDPASGGKIFSGNYYKNISSWGKPDDSTITQQGMLIHMKDGYIHFGGKGEAKIYSGSHEDHTTDVDGFCLDPRGLSIGKGVRIEETGEFYLGYGDEFSAEGERKYMHFNPTDKNNTFKIGEDVELIASKITADAIRGLDLVISDGGQLRDANNNFILTSNGTLTINSGEIHLLEGEIGLGGDVPYSDGVSRKKFQVDSNGQLYTQNAVVEGTLTAGAGSRIGNWIVDTRDITNFGSYVGLLIGRDTSNTDIIRLFPTQGKIGFRTGASDWIYIGSKPNVENTLYICKNLNDEYGIGNLECNDIGCNDIGCNDVSAYSVHTDSLAGNGNGVSLGTYVRIYGGSIQRYCSHTDKDGKVSYAWINVVPNSLGTY